MVVLCKTKDVPSTLCCLASITSRTSLGLLCLSGAVNKARISPASMDCMRKLRLMILSHHASLHGLPAGTSAPGFKGFLSISAAVNRSRHFNSVISMISGIGSLSFEVPQFYWSTLSTYTAFLEVRPALHRAQVQQGLLHGAFAL